MSALQMELFSTGAQSEEANRPNRVLVWTRMQTESGEDLSQILQRKEWERLAGNGLFFWGIGNSLRMPNQSSRQDEIPVVFSRMISKAKEGDVRPGAVLIWRKFFSPTGTLQDLPAHALVTSKAYTSTGLKQSHYALVCRSSSQLGSGTPRPFDPTAYRNLGGGQRPVGFSQVTAVIEQVGVESNESRYAIDFQAVLRPPYILKLADPVLVEGDQIAAPIRPRRNQDWLDFVGELRAKRNVN